MTDPHPHSRAALAQRYGPNYRWRVLLTVMIGTMASIMASTIINVAVPDMSRVFGLDQARAQWLSAGFMAAMTLSMLTTPWLLERFGYHHAYIGAVLLPAGIVLALTIPIAGRMADRLPLGRIVAAGLLLLATSFLLMVSVGPVTSLWWIVLWAVIGRVGLGFVLPSLNLGAMLGLPVDFISQGASTINFMRQLGGAVGISLVGIVLESRLQAQPADPVGAFHETFVLIGVLTACAVLAALRMGGAPRHGAVPTA